jgi:hypothetical protein
MVPGLTKVINVLVLFFVRMNNEKIFLLPLSSHLLPIRPKKDSTAFRQRCEVKGMQKSAINCLWLSKIRRIPRFSCQQQNHQLEIKLLEMEQREFGDLVFKHGISDTYSNLQLKVNINISLFMPLFLVIFCLNSHLTKKWKANL